MVAKEALVLGALLHDIGKFEFRTADIREAHTSYGEYFVREYLGPVGCLRPILEDVRRLVAYHHDSELADPFLREADHLAAAERVVDHSTQTRRSLVSVLASVDIGKGSPPSEVFRYAPGTVDYANPFPERVAGTSPATWQPDKQQMLEEHQRAWEVFCAEIRRIPDCTLAGWVETLLGLTRKHLCRVVSAAYKSHPDITLYDHGRSVAAIALCLREAGTAGQPFLLLQGDISGIQNFIYKLASPEEEGGTKNLAKRLRGRSFYLSLLSESVALFYLRKLDLPTTNLLFCGGGHFTILAPNTAQTQAAWQQAEREVNQWLFAQLHGELALVSAATPATRDELRDFTGLLQSAATELSRAKRRKFQSVLSQQFFTPAEAEETMDVCPVCQADFKKGSGRVCPSCTDQAETGRQILRATYLIRVEGDGVWMPKCVGDFGTLGVTWKLAEDWTAVTRAVEALRDQQPRRIHVERLNDLEFVPEGGAALAARVGCELSFGFRPLGQYAPADDEGSPLDFSELAKKGTEQYPLLGVVRMDVDLLGTAFAVGLGQQRSLSRVATMSRELEIFFLGYVNTLAQAHEIYITYSGGDDLFVVGSWINALHFCRALNRDFRRFACHNPNLTISAGVLFCKPGLPVARMAEMAGELEGRAKDAGRNGVAMFGNVVSWERLDKLIEFGDTLLELMDSPDPGQRLPRSFVHRLISLLEETHDSAGATDMGRFIRNQVRLKYLVARRGAVSKAIDAYRAGTERNPKVGALARLVTEPELMEQIAIPASYVLYRTRNRHQED